MLFKDRQEVPQTIENSWNADARAGLQDHDAGTGLRRETGHLAKIMVESDECSAFARTYLKQLFIRGSAKILIPDGHHIVTSGAQEFQAVAADVSSSLNFTLSRLRIRE